MLGHGGLGTAAGGLPLAVELGVGTLAGESVHGHDGYAVKW